MSDDLPFNSRGGLSFQHYFPVDAEYVVRIKVTGNTAAPSYDMRLPVKAGLRTVGVTFLRESPKAEAEAPPSRLGGASAGGPPPLGPPIEMDLRLDGAKVQRYEIPQRVGARTDVASVVVGGPYNASGRGETPSRDRIFVCRPADAAGEEPCARKILVDTCAARVQTAGDRRGCSAADGFLSARRGVKAISIPASRRRSGRC